MIISFISLFLQNILLSYKEGIFFLIGGFYFLIVTIYPFTSNLIIQSNFNHSLNIIWISLLFSIILTLENIFHKDYKDGSLDLLFLIKIPLEYLILIKDFIFLVTIGLPLIIITPLLFIILNLEFNYYFLIVIGLAIFNLINISVICASLTLSLNQRGILLSLITLPLSIPILIFSLSKVSFFFIFGGFVIIFSITPLITASILRLSFE